MLNLRQLIRDNRGFLGFLLIFGLVRTAVADYNPVPSGSMHPTILEGDVVLVNRLAYDLKVPLSDITLAHLGDPQRGDIVTFSSPKDGVRLIKRVIGLPGETVEMTNKQLRINGQPVAYSAKGTTLERIKQGTLIPALQLDERMGKVTHQIQWLAGIENAPSFPPITIPSNHYLMLGDNRDNSADSRFIGLVPRTALIGRADRILVSAAITDNWMPRLGRFGKSLYD